MDIVVRPSLVRMFSLITNFSTFSYDYKNMSEARMSQTVVAKEKEINRNENMKRH